MSQTRRHQKNAKHGFGHGENPGTRKSKPEKKTKNKKHRAPPAHLWQRLPGPPGVAGRIDSPTGSVTKYLRGLLVSFFWGWGGGGGGGGDLLGLLVSFVCVWGVGGGVLPDMLATSPASLGCLVFVGHLISLWTRLELGPQPKKYRSCLVSGKQRGLQKSENK